MKTKKYIIFIFSFLLLSMFFLVSCNNDKDTISTVQKGFLTDYPDKTIGDAAEGIFYEAKWNSEAGEGNTHIVSISGKIEVFGEEEKKDAVLKFLLNNDNNQISVHSMEIDGSRQGSFMINGFLTAMYQ